VLAATRARGLIGIQGGALQVIVRACSSCSCVCVRVCFCVCVGVCACVCVRACARVLDLILAGAGGDALGMRMNPISEIVRCTVRQSVMAGSVVRCVYVRVFGRARVYTHVLFC